jgi:hypothetical protein
MRRHLRKLLQLQCALLSHLVSISSCSLTTCASGTSSSWHMRLPTAVLAWLDKILHSCFQLRRSRLAAKAGPMSCCSVSHSRSGSQPAVLVEAGLRAAATLAWALLDAARRNRSAWGGLQLRLCQPSLRRWQRTTCAEREAYPAWQRCTIDLWLCAADVQMCDAGRIKLHCKLFIQSAY